MTTISAETLAKLRTFDTPTICNVIELFEVRPRNTGYMDANIVACFPDLPPMVGFASTATYRSFAPPRAGDVYFSYDAQVERFAELDGPVVVVFQDLDDPPAAATIGEIMCTAYKTFGAVGLITSGAARDLDQVRALEFPVFARGINCSHGYAHIPQIHVPVRVGGIIVYPNDLIHGDRNGVTTIPHEIASEVAEIAPEFVAAEAIILNGLREMTNPTPQRLKELRAASKAAIEKLRQRVSRKKH
ncbi:MAG: RraA family protein [Anaerolineae bacterium]|nr:RraA family protein [Anaerolineae bacterium]